MIDLSVQLSSAEGDLLRAGEIRVADPDPVRGRTLRGEFRYASPYDLTPDEPAPGAHVLYLGKAGHRHDSQALADLSRAFGLSSAVSRRIRTEVADAVTGWRRRFAGYGVDIGDIERLSAGIKGRTTILRLSENLISEVPWNGRDQRHSGRTQPVRAT